jgi:carboxyl-terminal processing protease
MTSRLARSLLMLALAAALPATTLADAPAASAETRTDIRAKETFAIVWERLQNSGFDGEYDGVDWKRLKTEHQADIEGAADLKTLRHEIGELIDAIGVSHLSLVPAESLPKSADAQANDGSLGMRVALIDGALLVASVEPGSPAAAAGIRSGWRVDRIGEMEAATAIGALAEQPAGASRHRAELLFQHRVNNLVGETEPGRRIALQLRDSTGRAHLRTLTATKKEGASVRLLPGMPPMTLRYVSRRQPLADGGCALHVEFDLWAMPAFERMLRTLQEDHGCRALVLDLRGNPGGMLGSMGAIGGLLFDQPSTLGTMRTGDGDLNLAILPREVADDGSDIRRMSGPVAILIDRGSASCSEVFTSGLQAVGRARVFGETSAGMALPAMSTPLPSGDWLYYPMADFHDPKQRRIEGIGVVPDVPVALTAESLATADDHTLQAALLWLSSSAPSSSAPSSTGVAAAHPSAATSKE